MSDLDASFAPESISECARSAAFLSSARNVAERESVDR
jgi:hypothetical protein